MYGVSAKVAAGTMMLVTLSSFASSYVIPVQPIVGPWNYAYGNYIDQNLQEAPFFNGNVNPFGYNIVPNNLNLYNDVNYNPNPHNGMLSSEESLDNTLYSVDDYNPTKVAKIGMDASGDNSNFFGLSMPMVTGGTAVGATPDIEASTSKMVTTTTAPLSAPTTTAPLEDSTPYPLITGASFTTGAPDEAAVTASY